MPTGKGTQQITVVSTTQVIIAIARKIGRLKIKLSRGRFVLAATMHFLKQNDATILAAMEMAARHVQTCGGKK